MRELKVEETQEVSGGVVWWAAAVLGAAIVTVGVPFVEGVVDGIKEGMKEEESTGG